MPGEDGAEAAASCGSLRPAQSALWCFWGLHATMYFCEDTHLIPVDYEVGKDNIF